MNVDVVVVGAGVAGLAAAASLRAARLGTIVLEAGSRVGGRAWTVEVAGAPFDAGASWLHNAASNPVTALAQRYGAALIDADRVRTRRRYVDGRVATETELADFRATWDVFTDLATMQATRAADISLADAIAPLRDRPWTATVEYWEASLIAAADPRRLSVRDWHVNLLDGENREIAGGIGAFVAREMRAAAGPLRLRTPATRIAWNEPGGRVRVDTPDGPVHAGACIVTVSTGVLAAGGIRFDPPLPVDVGAAIDGLPMGLLSKIALPAIDADRLGIEPSTSLQMRVEQPGEAVVSFFCWPFGRPYVVGFMGGPAAWALAREGDGAVEDFARSQLRAMLGTSADRTLGAGFVTPWADDPCFAGAYAYATPGNAEARGVLGTPLAEGRLIFAGEAVCTDGLAGTVGGACLSGRRAAGVVAEALSEGVGR